MTEEEHHFKLEIPFIGVVSMGGPYDDESFTAGFQVGNIFGVINDGEFHSDVFVVYSNLIHQIDLLAMSVKCKTEIIKETDKWGLMRITKLKGV